MESQDAGFSPFPHSLEIPLGFPHSHGLDDWLYVFSWPFNSNHRHRKGVVTDVSGPHVTHVPVHSPLSEVCLPYARASARKIYWGGRCGKERPAEAGGSGRVAARAREEPSSLEGLSIKSPLTR